MHEPRMAILSVIALLIPCFLPLFYVFGVYSDSISASSIPTLFAKNAKKDGAPAAQRPRLCCGETSLTRT